MWLQHAMPIWLDHKGMYWFQAGQDEMDAQPTFHALLIRNVAPNIGNSV